ncbi:MAG: hypothetical protein ABSF84_06495 [Acidimicrobiales bacterium]
MNRTDCASGNITTEPLSAMSPSPAVVCPTATQLVVDGQATMARSPDTAGGISAFQTDPPLLETTIAMKPGKPRVPTATHAVDVMQSTPVNVAVPLGTVDEFHVAPPVLLVKPTVGVVSDPPTVAHAVTVAHAIDCWIALLGKLSDVQLSPPSVDLTATFRPSATHTDVERTQETALRP